MSQEVFNHDTSTAKLRLEQFTFSPTTGSAQRAAQLCALPHAAMYLGGAEEEDEGDDDVDLNEKMLHTMHA
jgi:hypothetical protein